MIPRLIEMVARLGVEGVFKRYYGIYEAVVEDVEDDQNRGRVRVRIPALGQKRAPRQVWAVPAVFGGSRGAGVISPFIVGDHVYVQFVSGNASKPVVMGGFPAKGTASEDFSSSLRRGIRTPNGHWIRFSDDEDDPFITVSTSDGSALNFKNGEIVLENKKGHALTLKESGEASLKSADGSLTLDGSEAVVSVGKSSVTLTATGVTVSSTREVRLKAANVTVEAGQIDLGAAAAHSVVLGPTMVLAFNTHAHPTAVGPTGTPLVPMTNAVLSKTVKTS